VSPILVRPVREQLEHDRIIRLLHSKSRRRYEAGMNPGVEQNVPVGTGATALYPDLVLMSQDRGHRLEVVVEVETGESVNHLEALAQWAHLARVRAAFHLYVPSGMVDVARRLSDDNHITVSEIWSYHAIGEDVRFTLVHRTREAPAPVRRVAATTSAAPARRKPPSPPLKRSATAAKASKSRQKVAKKAIRTQKRK
jgi:hypothetical protein